MTFDSKKVQFMEQFILKGFMNKKHWWSIIEYLFRNYKGWTGAVLYGSSTEMKNNFERDFDLILIFDEFEDYDYSNLNRLIKSINNNGINKYQVDLNISTEKYYEFLVEVNPFRFFTHKAGVKLGYLEILPLEDELSILKELQSAEVLDFYWDNYQNGNKIYWLGTASLLGVVELILSKDYSTLKYSNLKYENMSLSEDEMYNKLNYFKKEIIKKIEGKGR